MKTKQLRIQETEEGPDVQVSPDEADPDGSGPHLDRPGHEVPVGAVAQEGEHLGAAQAEHEQQRREDVDPEVDDHGDGEDVDGLVAVVGVHPKHPDCARDQPRDLKQDINWRTRVKIFSSQESPGRTNTTTLSRASEMPGHRLARAGLRSSKSR